MTHISSNGHENQLDYILVDNRIRGRLRDVEANRLIDLGSDPPSLKATIEQKANDGRKEAKETVGSRLAAELHFRLRQET